MYAILCYVDGLVYSKGKIRWRYNAFLVLISGILTQAFRLIGTWLLFDYVLFLMGGLGSLQAQKRQIRDGEREFFNFYIMAICGLISAVACHYFFFKVLRWV